MSVTKLADRALPNMENPDTLEAILAALAATGELTDEDLRLVLEETVQKK